MQYQNPILLGDYSDPDVIRVGEDFYMISSSFTYLPGIPVLRSRDLVHWTLIGYAAARLPFARYNTPQHRCGTWAPSLRWRDGLFYVYVCLSDEGLICLTASDPAGEWQTHWVKDVTGWIDPCPLFADDGRVWLVHGFAASRAGINNLLYVHELSRDGLKVLDKGTLVYNGADHGDTTVEGPKFYQRGGEYWILCPAGGVATGYQLALRAGSPLGPYERRVMLAQGGTEVNGPHQGALFDDGHGREWFIHFQDVGIYGRVPHLQPVRWADGWPVAGRDGEPVSGGDTGLAPAPGGVRMSDDFADGLGLQWQWQANPDPAWYRPLKPGLRLYAAKADNPYHAGAFLSQMMQAWDFLWECRITRYPASGDICGVGVMGFPYHCLVLEGETLRLVRGDIREIDRFTRERVTETVLAEASWPDRTAVFWMRVRGGRVTFGCRRPDEAPGTGVTVGETVPMACGGWTSARPGLFCLNLTSGIGGYTDVAWVHVSDKGTDRLL